MWDATGPWHRSSLSPEICLDPLSAPHAALHRLGGYEMHDLVVLDNTTVGVIVNVEQDALRVLTNQVGLVDPQAMHLLLPGGCCVASKAGCAVCRRTLLACSAEAPLLVVRAGSPRQARHPGVPPARHQAQDEQPAGQR